MKNSISFILCFCLIFFFSNCKNGNTPIEEKKNNSIINKVNFFESDEAIALTLKSNFDHLLNSSTDDDDQAAWITVKSSTGETLTEKIKLRERGVTRRKICDFPPLKINLDNDLSSYNLKLVTHCQQQEDLQQLVFKEYLIYKMYNLVSYYSFRVQLAKVTYEDETGKMEPIEKHAFFIEDQDQMADRLKAKVLETTIQPKYLALDHARLFSAFQYLIGNTDWNLGKRHNLKMITPEGMDKPLPVPYDFDYSGLVNAPYAIPHHNMPIDNVKERYFMWRGKNKEGFGPVIELFKKNFVLVVWVT